MVTSSGNCGGLRVGEGHEGQVERRVALGLRKHRLGGGGEEHLVAEPHRGEGGQESRQVSGAEVVQLLRGALRQPDYYL